MAEWISVEDRLPDPKEYDWVLGALKTTELTKGCNYYLLPHIVELRNGEWWAMDSDFPLKDLFEEVTHWMPLPELPKELLAELKANGTVDSNTTLPELSEYVNGTSYEEMYQFLGDNL